MKADISIIAAQGAFQAACFIRSVDLRWQPLDPGQAEHMSTFRGGELHSITISYGDHGQWIFYPINPHRWSLWERVKFVFRPVKR